MARLDKLEIFKRLNEAVYTAGELNVKLTYTHKLFFLKLLNIVEEDSRGYYFQLTIRELSGACGTPMRTVSDCLAQLSAIGVIRVERRGKPSLRRIDKYYVEYSDCKRGQI